MAEMRFGHRFLSALCCRPGGTSSHFRTAGRPEVTYEEARAATTSSDLYVTLILQARTTARNPSVLAAINPSGRFVFRITRSVPFAIEPPNRIIHLESGMRFVLYVQVLSGVANVDSVVENAGDYSR